MEATVRAATPDDWPAIAALLNANALPVQGAHDHLPAFVVADADGEPVGCAGAEVYGRVALLRSVAVRPEWHGCGAGRQMLSVLLPLLAQRGVDRLFLLTTTAPGYFARLGFVVMKREDAPLELAASAEFKGACPATAVLMGRELSPAGPDG